MEVSHSQRQPGDLILDRYMPNASQEEREQARANLRGLLAALVRYAKWHARQGGGQVHSRPQEEDDTVTDIRQP